MAYKVMVAFTKNANEYDKDKQLECFEECGYDIYEVNDDPNLSYVEAFAEEAKKAGASEFAVLNESTNTDFASSIEEIGKKYIENVKVIPEAYGRLEEAATATVVQQPVAQATPTVSKPTISKQQPSKQKISAYSEDDLFNSRITIGALIVANPEVATNAHSIIDYINKCNGLISQIKSKLPASKGESIHLIYPTPLDELGQTMNPGSFVEKITHIANKTQSTDRYGGFMTGDTIPLTDIAGWVAKNKVDRRTVNVVYFLNFDQYPESIKNSIYTQERQIEAQETPSLTYFANGFNGNAIILPSDMLEFRNNLFITVRAVLDSVRDMPDLGISGVDSFYQYKALNDNFLSIISNIYKKYKSHQMGSGNYMLDPDPENIRKFTTYGKAICELANEFYSLNGIKTSYLKTEAEKEWEKKRASQGNTAKWLNAFADAGETLGELSGLHFMKKDAEKMKAQAKDSEELRHQMLDLNDKIENDDALKIVLDSEDFNKLLEIFLGDDDSLKIKVIGGGKEGKFKKYSATLHNAEDNDFHKDDSIAMHKEDEF